MKLNKSLLDENSAYLIKKDLVADDTVTGDVLDTGTGGLLGKTTVQFRAANEVTLPEDKVMTLKIFDADDADKTNDEEVGSVEITGESGDTVYDEYEVIWEFILPRDVRRYTYVEAITDGTGVDADLDGAVDAFCAAAKGFATNI